MGTYITGADLYNMFGQPNVDKFAGVSTAAGATAAERIDAAIEYAEATVESAFVNTEYDVPFTLNGSDLTIVKGWMAVLAIDWLRRARGIDTDEKDHIQVLKEKTESEMRMVIAGLRSFRSGEYDSSVPTVPVGVELS